MTNFYYSKTDLERIANALLRYFDAERLEIPKPIDVYAVIEKCLDVPYDWKYISPDESIWGLTFFAPGYWWIWPERRYKNGMLPDKAFYDKGTIVINSFLTEIPSRGPENFTVMHEVFHQVLHKEYFTGPDCKTTHATRKKNLYIRTRRMNLSRLEICEYQANFCAACFLMPRVPVINMFRSLVPRGQYPVEMKSVEAEMAVAFSVSNKVMRYRLQELKLLH